MRVLVYGAGAIGTLHGWALADAGHDVTLLVRPQHEARWAEGVQLRVLDARRGRAVEVTRPFRPRIVTTARDPQGYDVVLLTVRHNQTAEVLPALAADLGDAILVFLNNNWRGLGFIDAQLDKHRYVLGAPRAGGSLFNGVLDGALEGGVMLGSSINGRYADPITAAGAQSALDRATELFGYSGFAPEIHPNMEHWLWVHFASTAAWICGRARAGGFAEFAGSTPAIYAALRAGREAVAVCTARGADVRSVLDAGQFLMPPLLMAPAVRLSLRQELASRIWANHGRYTPDQLLDIYRDVVATGLRLGVPMPRLLSYAEDVDRASRRPARPASHRVVRDSRAPDRNSRGPDQTAA
jgi:2-dehydropantoate 2-reductase